MTRHRLIPVLALMLASMGPVFAQEPAGGKEVVIAPPGAAFRGSTEVTLVATLSPGERIVYTTDGTKPSAVRGMAVGNGETLSFQSDTTLRAAVLDAQDLVGPVDTAVFLRLGADMADFSSNLPFLILDSGRAIAGTSSPTLTPARCLLFDLDDATGRASVGDIPSYAGNSGLRIRGRSSAGFPKKQYKFEIWEENEVEQKVNLLGMGGESDWVLSAPYTDKSLMRNLLTFRLWQEAGWPSLDGRFVEVFLNSDNDREITYQDDYQGVYVLVEAITIDDDRIDIGKPEDPAMGEEITGGYIIEMGNADTQEFTTTGSGRSVAHRHKDPNRAALDTTQRTWIQTAILDFERALYAPDFRHPRTNRHYSEYTEVASQVDYKIFREWTRNFDGGSTFFYVPRGGKLTMGPLWDYNWALGNVNYAEGGDLAGYRTDGWNRSFTANLNGWSPWWLRFEQDPEWWQLLTDRWYELRHGPLSTLAVYAMIDEMAALLDSEAAGRNFVKWPVLGQFTVISPPGYQSRTTYQSEVDYLKTWLRGRMAWMDRQFLVPPVITSELQGEAIAVNLASPDGTTYYTIDGTDPRAPGGSHSASASLSGDGAVDVTFLGEDAASRYHVPLDDSLGETWREPAFDDAGWSEGEGGLGFESPGGSLLAAITTDVRAEMFGKNASLFARYAFEFEGNPLSVNSLTLRIRYDDAFVAWLNGVEVARDEERTFPEVEWNSYATSSHSDSLALEFFEIDLTPHAGQLVSGRNVLAVQIMNTSAGSGDALLQPVLLGNYNSTGHPLLLTESTSIQARTLKDGLWSAPILSYIALDETPANAQNMVISEIMFHPATPDPTEVAAGFTDQDEFEFLELHNTGPLPVTIHDLSFRDGIFFDFARGSVPSIAPHGYVVVVSNPVAFQMRYGAGISIAGTYQGRLRNSGETLALGRLGEPSTIEVTYADSWQPDADGPGYSLVLKDDSTAPSNWSSSAAWGRSFALHGSPGQAEPVGGYATWLTRHFTSEEIQEGSLTAFEVDLDRDLRSNLLEFAAGSNPRAPDGGLVRSTGYEAGFLVLTYRPNPEATGLEFSYESSADLSQWSPLQEASRETLPDGVLKVRFPTGGVEGRMFIRVVVTVEQ